MPMTFDPYASDCFDRQGRPISEEECGRLRADRAYRRVDSSHLTDTVWVSTVWVGMNHNYDMVGPPLIFETMVFGGPDNDTQRRYATEEEARAGHLEVCASIMAWIN